MTAYEDIDENCIRREMFRRMKVHGYQFTNDQLEIMPKLWDDMVESNNHGVIWDIDERTTDKELVRKFTRWMDECKDYPKRIASRYGPEYQEKIPDALRSWTASRLGELLMCSAEEAIRRVGIAFPEATLKAETEP